LRAKPPSAKRRAACKAALWDGNDPVAIVVFGIDGPLLNC
jgi:hypothetical protein